MQAAGLFQATRKHQDSAAFLRVTLFQLPGHYRELVVFVPMLMGECKQLRRIFAGAPTMLRVKALKMLEDRLGGVAHAHPDAVAIVDGRRRISYRELLLRADALARELEGRGIGPREFVGVSLPRSAELVVAIVGVVRAGAAYVPIDLNQPAERRELILSDAHPRVIVTDGARADGIPPGIEILPLPQYVPEGTERQRRRPELEDPAYVIYTSGSTGQPKGVIVTQYNVARLFTITEPLFNFSANDVWTLFHSIGFDVSVWELWGALLHGARLVVVPETTARGADAFHALVVREGVTVLSQTPSAFRAFDAADAAAGRPNKQLRHIMLAGEALDPHTLNGWFEAHGDEQPRVGNMYGITETTVHVTYRRMFARDACGNSRSLIGAPLADLSIDLVGPDRRPLVDGEVGEIYVRGAGVTAGYLGRPELTAERFLPDPRSEDANARLYRSGDLGRRMPNGDIEYLGRVDDQVKLRGFRIELGEIEAALRKAANVRDAVVALRNNSIAGPQLIAYVVQDNRTPLDAPSLREHLTLRLPEYMVPATYIRIDRIPRTINDKVDRAALPAPIAADRVSVTGGEAPRDDVERTLAQIFSDLLNTTVTTRESDFFRLGGDSLLAMRVAILCEEHLNVNLSTSSIFDNPTVMALAGVVHDEKKQSRRTKRVARVPRGNMTPLSPQQYALWLDLKIRPDTDAYNEASAFRIAGHLEPKRLFRALVQLAQTNEVLCSRLIEVNGEPQLVFDRKASAIEFEFWETDISEEAERKLTEAMRRPFNLHQGPLWRALLCNESNGQSVMLLVIHHLILDAPSEKSLLQDLIAAYGYPDAPRKSRAYDFADLAAHERICLDFEREALDRFWAKNLAGAVLTPVLPPPCVPCAPEEDDSACISRREIEPALVGRIRDLAASWGSTPFHLYLTAYLALLRAYAATDDLVIGSPISLRDTLAAEGVVGYLLSPVPLRVQLAGGRSFRKTVEEVARQWQDVRTHARLPTHLVLQAARTAERAGIASPIQVFFSLLQDPTESLFIGGYALRRIHIAPAHAKFKLFLLVEERKHDASFVLQFRRGDFDREMADRLLRHLEVLLLAAINNPESTLARLPLADQTELAQLREWEGRSTPYPRDRTIVDIFEQVAGERKGDTALVVGQDRISYETLDRRANAIAAMLRRAGVGKGDRVPLLLPRGVRFIACALGVMKCGAAYVPFDPSYPPERLRRMLVGLEARVGLGEVEVSCRNSGVSWLDASLADELSSVPAPPREIGAEDPAYVMFTSGSTGWPKGVEVPHRAVVRLVFGQDFARIGPTETWLHIAPTSFDASTLEIWAPLLHGGRCAVLEEGVPTPNVLANVIRQESVTSAWITASLFNALVDEAPACLSGLAQILIGGEALSPSHVRRALDCLPGVRLVNGYGPTENTTFTCCHVIRREDVDPRRTIPIGRPIANTTVHVLQSDGSLAPVGVPGVLVAGGDGVALGYIGQPERTEPGFLPDTLSQRPDARLYRSGDRVRWRPDGTLDFLGRFDNQIKIRGRRVEPGDIAACLAEHEFVRQVVVVLKRAASGANQLVACVVPRSTDTVPKLRMLLIRHANERLPPYMVPASFLFLRELPLKSNGKLDLAALNDVQHDSAYACSDAPIGSVEARILKIFRDVLNREDLSLDDDFFEAGGDSLLVITLMFRLESEFGPELPRRVISEVFTARRMATILENLSVLRATYPAGVVRIKNGATDRPLFCLPGLGSAVAFRTLAAKMHTRRPLLGIELHSLGVEPSVLESIEGTAGAIVRVMREVQPVGPYAIVGYSLGGNLAVEVARQLTDNDQRIELLTVLDAYVPSSLPKGLSKVAMRLRIIAGMHIRECYAYIFRCIQRLQFSRFRHESEIEQRIAEVTKRSLRAYYAHRPESFSGRIVVMRASDLGNWREIADPSGTCGWSSVCEGGVDIIPVACGHYDFFKEPHVTHVAGHIDDLLKAIDNRTDFKIT
jgi:amino acid adenylation domain-containing protein